MKYIYISLFGICLTFAALGIPAALLSTPGRVAEKKVEEEQKPPTNIIAAESATDGIKYYIIAIGIAVASSVAAVFYYCKPKIKSGIKSMRIRCRRCCKKKDTIE